MVAYVPNIKNKGRRKRPQFYALMVFDNQINKRVYLIIHKIIRATLQNKCKDLWPKQSLQTSMLPICA
jgi:hypothetical protein